MSTLATLTNHQVRLASRPVGLPTRANWSFTQEPVAEPADGRMKSKEDVVKGLDTFPGDSAETLQRREFRQAGAASRRRVRAAPR